MERTPVSLNLGPCTCTVGPWTGQISEFPFCSEYLWKSWQRMRIVRLLPNSRLLAWLWDLRSQKLHHITLKKKAKDHTLYPWLNLQLEEEAKRHRFLTCDASYFFVSTCTAWWPFESLTLTLIFNLTLCDDWEAAQRLVCEESHWLPTKEKTQAPIVGDEYNKYSLQKLDLLLLCL